MAKKYLNGNKDGNGFDKNPQNINRTGLNRKLPILTEAMIDELSMDELKAIVKKHIAKGKAGDVRSAEFVFKYAYGEAKQYIEHSGMVESEQKQTECLTFEQAYVLKYGKKPE